MVAEYTSRTGTQETTKAPGATGVTGTRERARDRGVKKLLSDMVQSLVRAWSLQVQIWITRAKMTVANALIRAALWAGAGVLALLAVIFLYIGIFELLTDVAGLRRTWAFLIYFGVHVVGAAILAAVAKSKSGGKC